MISDWDVLGDRPLPAFVPARLETTHSPLLCDLPAADAELIAILAAVVARYTGRGDVALGWSDGGPWRRVELTVDVAEPFAVLAKTAASAVARSAEGAVPS